MKLGRLLIAAVLLAGLSAAVWWSNRKAAADAAKPPAETSPKILALKKEDVRQIEFKRRDGEATVVKQDGSGKWQITAPKPLLASQTAVDSLTATLSDVKSDRLLDEHATDLASYGLAPAVLELDITLKDGKTSRLLLGEETPTGSDVYAKLENDPRLFTAASSTKTELDKTSKDLRDKNLLLFDRETISRVELTAKKQTVEFGRIGQGEWQILKPKPMRADTFQVDDLVGRLRGAALEPMSPEDEKKAAAAFGLAVPVAVAKVTDAKGTQTIEVRKAKDDYYAKSSMVAGIQKVGADLGTGLDKVADDFRNKKLFDFGFSDPTRLEFKDGAKTAVYEKSGGKWVSAGKTMDSVGIQAFIDKIRDLSTSKFLETGFTAPAVELTVVSNDGKRTEKVQIAASGANFIARRENEATLYELDAKTVQDLRQAGNDVREEQPANKKK